MMSDSLIERQLKLEEELLATARKVVGPINTLFDCMRQKQSSLEAQISEQRLEIMRLEIRLVLARSDDDLFNRTKGKP